MLRPIQPLVEYALNQDYIAEFLCINKDKPQLQCNGKCHLAKQLEKQQEKEPLSPLKVSLENYPIGFVFIYKLKKPDSYIITNKQTFLYNHLYNFSYSQNTFQPPELV